MQIAKTTTHLKLPRVRLDIPAPISVAICIVCLAGILAAIGRIQTTPAAAMPTPGLIVLIATNAPAPSPPQAQQAAYVPQAPVVRMVVGFDSPNGTAMGAIPAPEASEIVARFGDEWLETTHDGAPIWIRASELGMNIADVAPQAPQLQPAPVVIYEVVNAPARPAPAVDTPEPNYAVVSEPQPTMQPAMAAIYDRQQWALQAAAAKP